MSRLSTIGVDADDTLWQSEQFFKLSEARFVELLKDYAGADHLKERLLEAEKRNLSFYGFGIKGFTLAMIETAIEVTGGNLPASTLQEILNAGREMSAHPIELLSDVRESLEELGKDFRLVLITKGDLVLNVTAKTYRYVDEEDQAAAAVDKGKKGKKGKSKKGGGE